GRVHHVGIYCGNGQMLHSPKTGKSIEVIPLKGTIYEKELCAIRRYF
ncbi:NlpC/P60 family protein, partial [Bacillus haynesii]